MTIHKQAALIALAVASTGFALTACSSSASSDTSASPTASPTASATHSASATHTSPTHTASPSVTPASGPACTQAAVQKGLGTNVNYYKCFDANGSKYVAGSVNTDKGPDAFFLKAENGQWIRISKSSVCDNQKQYPQNMTAVCRAI